MADILIPYLLENGYNYLEIMPLNEYPCDESWGLSGNPDSTGPTSRYGTAAQLMAFVDACHRNGIGVIMDFVPRTFLQWTDTPLANYDGTPLYEYPNSAVGVSELGEAAIFMHSRGEVRSFPSVLRQLLAEQISYRRSPDGTLSAAPSTGRAIPPGA